MSTERLYYSDSYLTQFRATVRHRSDDGRRVVLDRTAFYPTSGGQPFDTGRLGGRAVIGVVDDGETIAHLLDAPLLEDEVEGIVDWPRRLDHMRQHTGQHLLSAVLADLYGHQTVSVHFGAEYATLDLDAPELTPDQLREAERRANAVVMENRPVSVSFEDAATAAGLRKASDRSGTLRVVTIADLDRSACGGTHVRATGEIGPILIRGAERVKKQVRLEFRCGLRAVDRARRDLALLAGMAASASAGIDEVGALFEKQRVELAAAVSERRRLEEALHGYRAGELYHQAAPDAAGCRTIVLRDPPGGVEALRGIAQAMTGLGNALFVGTTATPPTIVVAATADSGVDAGQRLKPLLAGVGGRGGGSARIAQGTAPSMVQLDSVVAALLA